MTDSTRELWESVQRQQSAALAFLQPLPDKDDGRDTRSWITDAHNVLVAIADLDAIRRDLGDTIADALLTAYRATDIVSGGMANMTAREIDRKRADAITYLQALADALNAFPPRSR